MKLTETQIRNLFLFTEKKYVRYYDLQVELVDHLAIRIEEEMSANNKMSFEQALEKVYRDFGIFGFAKVVQEKEEQFVRMGRRLLLKELLHFFRWPEISLVAFIATTVAAHGLDQYGYIVSCFFYCMDCNEPTAYHKYSPQY